MSMNQADKMLQSGFMKASAAAAQTGNSVQTVYRWIEEGKVEGMKVAGHHYVKITSLVTHLGGPEQAARLGLLVSGL